LLDIKELELDKEKTKLLLEREALIKEKINNGKKEEVEFGRGSVRKDHDISQPEL
jgi:hypothetical protein